MQAFVDELQLYRAMLLADKKRQQAAGHTTYIREIEKKYGFSRGSFCQAGDCITRVMEGGVCASCRAIMRGFPAITREVERITFEGYLRGGLGGLEMVAQREGRPCELLLQTEDTIDVPNIGDKRMRSRNDFLVVAKHPAGNSHLAVIVEVNEHGHNDASYKAAEEAEKMMRAAEQGFKRGAAKVEYHHINPNPMPNDGAPAVRMGARCYAGAAAVVQSIAAFMDLPQEEAAERSLSLTWYWQPSGLQHRHPMAAQPVLQQWGAAHGGLVPTFVSYGPQPRS